VQDIPSLSLSLSFSLSALDGGNDDGSEASCR